MTTTNPSPESSPVPEFNDNSNNNEEEDEEEEEFYESLDRILSSTSSSTSTSDDDAVNDRHRHSHRSSLPPAPVTSLDIWTSEPASISERRRRLLQLIGLAGDPALSRSVSHDGFLHPSAPSPSTSSSTSSSSILRSRSDPVPVHVAETESPKEDLETVVEDPRCLIKNLDDGSEFVVKEEFRLREVGTGRQLTIEEFEMCVGRSPIVQELMRRQKNVSDSAGNGNATPTSGGNNNNNNGVEVTRPKKRASWLRGVRNLAGSVVAAGAHHYHHRDRRSSDEKDTSSEKGGRRSSSATDDSQDGGNGVHSQERIKVRQYGKSHREMSGLFLNQEIQAHNGSIWSIRFSLDGKYLASAGEDCVIHVWEVSEYERRRGEVLFAERGMVEETSVSCNPFVAAVSNGSPDMVLALGPVEGGSHYEKRRRPKVVGSRKSVSFEQLMVPEHVFALSEKPVCSFRGHSDDVLDLCWSKSMYLLSSSMDKTVRLWHMSSNSCLKTFCHSDYVTCIQFNPVDDRYFISGSLDEKVRIWSIPDRQIVDWNDLHEMVTAACYTPDGQSALIGSHKGSCHMYDTSDNKLLQKNQIDLQNKKKKSGHKKITGFQFVQGSSSKVVITSADSRIRVVDGVELIHKFKGFRNTNSQISASLAANGRYVISASEDSNVYIWRYDDDTEPSRGKGVVTSTNAYEHFQCQDVTVAVACPSTCMGMTSRTNSSKHEELDHVSNDSPLSVSNASNQQHSPGSQQQSGGILSTNSSHNADRTSATWPEELMTPNKQSPRSNSDLLNGGGQAPTRSAWGMGIVTAGRGGQIKTFQNFGFPVRV